jgi:hypothetical protein
MTYRIVYEADFNRVIPAVLIDGRAQYPALSGKTGFEMLPFLSAEIQKASVNSVFYKIETGDGNIAGYFTVTRTSGVLGIFSLRPQFLPDNAAISQQISNFISSGDWRFDFV